MHLLNVSSNLFFFLLYLYNCFLIVAYHYQISWFSLLDCTVQVSLITRHIYFIWFNLPLLYLVGGWRTPSLISSKNIVLGHETENFLLIWCKDFFCHFLYHNFLFFSFKFPFCRVSQNNQLQNIYSLVLIDDNYSESHNLACNFSLFLPSSLWVYWLVI